MFKKFLSSNPDRFFEGGKRFNKTLLKNHEPIISIITVVKNKSKFVQETIDSIKNQNYKNIEYIVVLDLLVTKTIVLFDCFMYFPSTRHPRREND